MNLNKFKHKSCFIFPFSPMSVILKNYLEKFEVKIKGFIDNNTTNKNTYKLKDIDVDDIDYIFIISPNHSKEIYAQTIRTIDKQHIVLVSLDLKTNKYNFFNDTKHLISKEDELESYFQDKSKSYTFENSILLVGLGFIDINIKYLYLYIKKYTDIPVYLATDNLRDIEIFKSYDIDVINCLSKEFIDLVFKCNVKIVDHSPTDKFIIKCLKIGHIVQLWHGVTVKMLGTQTDYKVIDYDIVLSTSEFVTDYSFSKLYNYKHIIHGNYPRNDILINDDIEIINVEHKLLAQMKTDRYRYIVYMPTYRPLGFEKNPIDYKKLNEFAKDNNLKFIIKMHPFIAQMTRESLDKYQDTNYKYTNLIIYPANMDIYPILKYSDMLLADYSSVYFDYLFINKPIVFFPYDYEEWQESADGTMLNYFEHSPGDKCYNLEELFLKIIANLDKDTYIDERSNILNKIFTKKTKNASAFIVDKIKELLFK